MNKEKSLDTEKLYIGQTVKNYKEMCSLLGEEVTTGKGKIYQLKDWKRYFDYEKSGQSFIITEIYDKPLPVNDKRSQGNNSIYVDYIMYLLMFYFSRQEGDTEVFYKVQLYKLLGMVNENYSERVPKDERDKIVDNLNSVTNYDIIDFYKRVPPKLEKILFTALNNLKRRCLLEYFEEYEITEEYTTGNSVQRISRLATNDEIKKIVDIKYEVLERMGLKDMWQVYYNGKSDKFYSLVNEIERERYGWISVFKRYKIIFSREHMAKDIHLIEEQIQRKLLNATVGNSLNEQARKRYEKKHTELELFEEWGFPDTASADSKTFTDTYLLAQNELTNYLIKLQIRE